MESSPRWHHRVAAWTSYTHRPRRAEQIFDSITTRNLREPIGLFFTVFRDELAGSNNLNKPYVSQVRGGLILMGGWYQVMRETGEEPPGLGAQPRPGSMTMAGQNEQVSTVCPKCTANLNGGRDLPGCWRCGWEDYSQVGTVLTPLIGSQLSELASRGQRQRYGRPSPSRSTK